MLAKRHNIHSANKTSRFKRLNNILTQIFAGIGSHRTSREVNGNNRSSPTTNHPCGNGRIYTARKKRHNLTRSTNRKTTNAVNRCSINICVTLNNMHIDRHIRIMHLNFFIREILAKHGAYKLVNLNGMLWINC